MSVTLRQESATGATTAARALTYAELDNNFKYFLDANASLAGSTGASMVGFVQSGSGSGGARSVQAELRDIFFNVKSGPFGAQGDGSTNDAAAMQAAHDALPSTGGILFWPGGTFIGGAAVNISKPCIIMGSGSSTSKVMSSGTNAVFNVTTSNVRFVDIQIGRKSGNASTIANLITGSAAHQITFTRCVLGGADTSEIDLDTYFSATFERCIFNARTAQTGKAINSRGSGGASTNLVIQANCEFNNYNQAIDITNTFGTHVENNLAVGCNRMVRYNSGAAHTFKTNWAESGGVSSTYAVEVAAGSGSVNQIVIAGPTRLAGTPITDLITYSGGGAATQVIVLPDFAIGPSSVIPDFNLQGNASLASLKYLFLDGTTQSKGLRYNSGTGIIEVTGYARALSGWSYARITPTYGSVVAIDASLGNLFVVTVTDASAFTIQNPSNAAAGNMIRIRIKNTSGGALGTLSFDTLYKIGAAWTQPANGKSRSIDFEFDGTNWVEANRSAADVSN